MATTTCSLLRWSRPAWRVWSASSTGVQPPEADPRSLQEVGRYPRESRSMNGAISIRPLGISSELLTKVCQYLTCRERGLSSLGDLERIWSEFYELYSHKIRRYAFACGTPEVDIADCVQEVWRELLVRLPSFRLDPRRGQFDTWVY